MTDFQSDVFHPFEFNVIFCSYSYTRKKRDTNSHMKKERKLKITLSFTLLYTEIEAIEKR